ncbi:methionyl-tRNA formyltransferase [Gottschalkiaceae bacterium SANA]|nr:methionyl-tRNA formyltransferase [Gottschalkiaceae bacterium SANA]
MKVVFMGTPDFSVSALNAIHQFHEIVMVVTQPDRARGRGKKVTPSPVKKRAVELGLPVYQPNRLRDPEAIEHVTNAGADVMVIVAYGQILPKEILDAPTFGCINIHASLLPKYRGAAPIHRAILSGDSATGITIMKMDVGLDTGDMYRSESIAISESMTMECLHDELSELGSRMIVDVLDGLLRGETQAVKQDEEKATYAAKISKAEAEIDWKKSAKMIHNQIRAFDPFPGAWTRAATTKLKVFASVCQVEDTAGMPGEILAVSRAGIQIQTGEGSLLIQEIQAPGKRRMTVEDFLRGNTLEKGVVLLSKEETQEA